MSGKTKLELTWIGKDHHPRLEPRILLPDEALSYHAPMRVSKDDIFDNKLIFGDNLLALKALESDYWGKIKCVFIDPPYNTGSAFEHYPDGLEHSLWLTMMRDRLVILRNLLADDGSLWITIDDNESHYLKVLCDEIFGRANFVANVVWQRRTSPDARIPLGAAHDDVLVFAKNKENTQLNKIPRVLEETKGFSNPDNDPRGVWTSSDFTAQGWRPNQMYTITSPAGKKFTPPEGRCWKNIEPVFNQLVSENKIWFGANGDSQPRRKTFFNDVSESSTWTWWPHTETGHNQEAKKEINELFGAESAFITPKPERLLQRIITIATNPGDLILDCFAGSGTTGAVAHKMRRRWIMVELFDHCHTHIIPRLKKVMDGTDQGGISKNVNWQGGGGFRYYKLAPSLIKKDRFGIEIINPDYNAEMLTEAMCKISGYKYNPHPDIYWQQGQSVAGSYLYVTTQNLSIAALDALAHDVGDDNYLRVYCCAYQGEADAYANMMIEKIPQAILDGCDWNHDGYALAITQLPQQPPGRRVNESGDNLRQLGQIDMFNQEDTP